MTDKPVEKTDTKDAPPAKTGPPKRVGGGGGNRTGKGRGRGGSPSGGGRGVKR